MAKVPHVAAGYHTVTPYLGVRDAVAAVDFYRRAFGAELVMKLTMPDGKYAHAEIKIGDSHIMDGLRQQVERRLQRGGRLYGYLIDGHGIYVWGRSIAVALRHLEAFDFLLGCEIELRRIKA